MDTRTDNSDGLTLAIYPNARGFGYALLNSPQDVIDVGIAYCSPVTNEACMKKVQGLVDDANPKLILLQSLTGKFAHKTSRVKTLIGCIEKFARAQRIGVKKYSRDDIRDVFVQFQGRTKYEIAQRIVHYLKQYEHLLPKYRKPWMADDYRMGIFDALSLAITHFFRS